MSDRFVNRSTWFCIVFPVLLFCVGCNELINEPVSDNSLELSDDPEAEAEFVPPAEAKLSSYQFEPAMIITAGGERIKVEEPGYAYPTLFDVDDDGSQDLIVGQFNGGKMKWYRNLSSPSQTPEYDEGKWINSGDDPAEVPGVS